MVESGNRAQKSVEIENRTQDLRVFSFACYQLSHIGRSESGGLGGMMKVRLFMIVFKNYSRLGACMHAANHPEGDTPRDLSVNHEFIYKGVQLPESADINHH